MTPDEQVNKWRSEGAYQSDHLYVENGKIFGRYIGEICPCMFCGAPTEAGTDAKCDNCWEMVSRIEAIEDVDLANKIHWIVSKKIVELRSKQ